MCPRMLTKPGSGAAVLALVAPGAAEEQKCCMVPPRRPQARCSLGARAGGRAAASCWAVLGSQPGTELLEKDVVLQGAVHALPERGFS